jgi:plasmid stabilization system protein ParE
MKLRFTPRALENIAHIADYLHARNPSAAQRVRDDIYDGLRNVILFPQVGRPQQTKGVRKLVTRRFAYLIYYTVDSAAAEIIVLSVKHPAQKRAHDDA